MAECGRLPSDFRRLPADCRFAVGLFLLRLWKQVDVCKVSRMCPVTALLQTLVRGSAEPSLGTMYIDVSFPRPSSSPRLGILVPAYQ